MNIINATRLAIVGASMATMIAMPAIVGAAANDRPITEDIGTGLTQFGGELGLSQKPLTEVIANIIRIILSLLGLVTVVIILLGGFKWMTAGGSDEKVKEAKKLIFQGIIGLAIVLSAFAISKFVVEGLAGAVSEN